MTIEAFALEISQWHLENFGDCSSERVLQKVKEEMREFIDYPSDEEAADVIIALFAWVFRNHGVMPAVLLAKWEIVKSRTDQKERDAARGIP